MRKPVYMQISYFIIYVSIILVLSSCSLIGYSLGLAIDHSEKMMLSGWRFDEVKPNSFIKIDLHDGRTLIGKFLKTGRLLKKEYKDKISDINRNGSTFIKPTQKNPITIMLPLPGDTIKLVTPHTGPIFGYFIGFEYGEKFGQLLMSLTPYTYTYYVSSFEYVKRDVYEQDRGHLYAAKISMDQVLKVSSKGDQVITGEIFEILLKEGKLPFLSDAFISTDLDTLRIPINEIEYIYILPTKIAREHGFAMGIAIDFTILITAIMTGQQVF
jgi:hypothetical protein